MKKLLLLPLLAFGALAGLVSCSDEDDIIQEQVPAPVMAKFQSMYPGVGCISWETEDNYYVAEFRNEGIETEAWYDHAGKWGMTKSEYGKNAAVLPEAVANVLAAAQYADYTLDDIDLYERPADTFYLIELDSTVKTHTDLYLLLAPDGTLINAIPELGRDFKIRPDSDLTLL